ncbi:phage tail tip fiber protein [Aeromonas veronii]|uniref:phage tail tip fiber protein n=1 Tax=Aeromonas veronii TaxID=654 RepID=UPI003B9EC34F
MAKKPAYRAGRDQAATAENVELLTGQRGDRLDKAVTFRELSALGLSTLRPGAGGVYVPGKNPDLFPSGQMEFPHAPVNVIANGAFHTVLVEWDPPRYRGHAHAEIWRAESDNQAEATLVGTSSANLFSDAIGKGAKFYYWVRFVNGKDDKGPFQGVQGVEAETSRDVQDILDELQGKIEESHLAQALLGPIEQVPQLQLDIAVLKPKVDEIEVKIPSIEQELAGLDERQRAAQDLLDDAQQQLGMSSIEIGLVQDRLNAKLDKYKGDFDSFRDAVFVVDPENGSITMDAVNAVREELHTSITEVQQELDAVTGQITSKADNVTVDSQGSRITEAEQRINGLDASLSQTVTRGEFTGEQQRVTQIGHELDATKGELTQKATKQEVDAQGVRLANAESKLTVHTDELSSQAQRLDGLSAQVTQGDETLQASITELARVSAESDQVTAQRVSGLEVRAGTSEAKIQALEEIIEDNGGITAGRFDTIIAELELQRGLDDDNASAAIDGALAVDERDRETRKAFGAIRTEQRVILTEQQAQAQRTTDMEVKFEAKDAATQARISSVEKVTSDADSALAQRIDNVTTEFKAADTALSASLSESSKALADSDRALGERISTLDVTVGENSASITELQQAVVSNEASLSQRQDKMESEIVVGAVSQVEGALAGDERDRENRKARGVILQQQSTLANQQEAQARTVEQLTAEFDAENAEIRAQITNEQLVRSTADEALAQKTSVLEAQIEGVDQSLSASIAEVARVSADADAVMTEKLNQQQSTMQTADAELSSRINEEATTRADAVESLASQIQQVTANYQQGDQQLQGQITAESVARADAVQALGSQINTVSAVAGSKNKTFFQATAPSSGMGTGDLWFDTANNNRPYRYSGTAWVATDDPRIAANAAAVQLQSQAIADLQNGAQAMWTAKASAGQITAGIGLVAKSDGTSQVAISASQVFVFNPNSSTPMAPLFAIDNGQAVIAEAIIRKATIQILTSEKITADYIKAGVSMSAPAISGGSIDMGNAFLSGGAAGFGKGGPYGGWSWMWHTIIYADGSLYTDRLFASNGSFTGTVNANAGTFQNVTIEETCNVKGTVYANKIVGDVLSAKVVSANSTDSAGSGHVVASASVKGSRTHAANLYCLGVTVEVYASGGYRPGGNDQDVPATISGRLVLTNSAGGIIATAPFKVRSESNISIAEASQSITIQGGFDAGTGAASISCAVIIDSQSASYGGSAGVRVPAQSIAFCLLPSGSQFN